MHIVVVSQGRSHSTAALHRQAIAVDVGWLLTQVYRRSVLLPVTLLLNQRRINCIVLPLINVPVITATVPAAVHI